tara:strand:+ start:52 stop:651 length:600 start_codon:yes stop_codon:yes gene_type:complete
MEDNYFRQDPVSVTEAIAKSGPFQIELMKYVGTNDYAKLIDISESLVVEYGKVAKLTPNTIQTYFNREGALPFIARHQDQIIGYIIGIPLEILSREPWARLDINFGQENTIYTYAFVIEKEYKANGYAKMLKKVYLNWIKKQDHIIYMTGHVKQGISNRFKGKIIIINKVKNWQGTGKTFEYYRREVDTERIFKSILNE